jgi:hypothetical protein
MTNGDGGPTVLERWAPTLFLVGGVALVAFAASLAAIGLVDVPAPRNVFAGVGFALAFLGLLGVYSGLVETSPWLARVGGGFAVLGAVGFGLTFVSGVAEFAGVALPAWVDAVQLLNLVGIVPGFLVGGVAGLRTDGHPRLLGGLLFVPAVVFAVNVARVAVLGAWTPPWAPVVLGSLQALAMLAIGYTLRTAPAPTERAERPTDSAA